MTMFRTKDCPQCDGQGSETVDVPRPQSFSRDVGELHEELRTCDMCGGSGEVEDDEYEDEDE